MLTSKPLICLLGEVDVCVDIALKYSKCMYSLELVELPCILHLSLPASSKENYTMWGVIFLAACLQRQIFHAWSFNVKVPMNMYLNDHLSGWRFARKSRLTKVVVIQVFKFYSMLCWDSQGDCNIAVFVKYQSIKVGLTTKCNTINYILRKQGR